jgi:hypothetical protein
VKDEPHKRVGLCKAAKTQTAARAILYLLFWLIANCQLLKSEAAELKEL